MFSDMMREGGTFMLFTLGWGLLGMGFSVFFAARPTRPRLGFLRAVTATILGSALCGTTAGLVATTRSTVKCFDTIAECTHPAQILVAGVGESIQNILLGLVFFTLISFISAFGRLRLSEG